MEELVVKLKRGWVKNAAIVFLSVMLVLTFFSNTIMNRSLPEVATAFVESGTVNTKIRGSGTVTAGESYDVVLSQTRKVESVYVRTGDFVQTGDVLFLLSGGDSEELKLAQDRLDDMRLSYEKSLLSMDDADYAQENRNIQKAHEALAEAKAELAACAVTDEEVYAAQTALRDGQRMQKELDKALSDARDLLSEETAAYNTLEAQAETLETQIETLEESVSDYKRQIRDLEDGIGNPKKDLNNAKAKLEDLQEEYAALRITYGTAFESLEEKAEDIRANGDLMAQMAALVKNKDDANLPDAQKATPEEAEAFEKLHEVIVKLEETEETVSELEVLVESAQSVEEQIETLERSKDRANDDLDEAEEALEETVEQLNRALRAKEDAAFQISYLEEQSEAQTDTVETLQEQYDDLKARQNDYESAKDRVDSCQDTLDDLTFALAEQKKADGKIAASQQLDLDNALKEIAEQEELVAELQAGAMGSEVTANVSGQISTLNAVAGRDAVAGETLAVIEIVDRGYTVRLPVTNEQAQKVRVGDKADVTNYYWGEELDVTLTQIINDPSKPGQGKLLVFTLNGDISSGQNVTLSVGERSANYDAIVPNSALRTDTNGTFVLILSVKHSPLGNRYIATRADVNVLAQDDTTAAVSGLSMGDYVITTSSKPLEAGMQVNMVEN